MWADCKLPWNEADKAPEELKMIEDDTDDINSSRSLSNCSGEELFL